MMDINWDKFVVVQLPKRMRVSTDFAFVRSLLAPIVYLFNKLKTYEATVRYKLEHTGQVWSIAAVLNDTFDPGERRIEVDDAGRDELILINRDTDDDLLLLGDDDEGSVLIHRDSDYGVEQYDFVVYIPFAFSEAEMYRLKALVNYYRLAGKRYDVVVKLV